MTPKNPCTRYMNQSDAANRLLKNLEQKQAW